MKSHTTITPTHPLEREGACGNDNALFEIQKIEEERLLSKKEIAHFLNVSVKMIDRKVLIDEIPYLKVGRLVRFSKKQILAWANKSNTKR